MGKRKLPRTKFASVIRTAISDARSDAKLWGHPVESGLDSPRNRASSQRARIGGDWSYSQGELYQAAYLRAKGARLKDLWSGRSPQELREARATVDHNRMLRNESRDQRELRLLRERVEAMERKCAPAETRELEGAV